MRVTALNIRDFPQPVGVGNMAKVFLLSTNNAFIADNCSVLNSTICEKYSLRTV